nr:MAG TPA: hypothetical protein [Caudoviricetes sp.]
MAPTFAASVVAKSAATAAGVTAATPYLYTINNE